VASTTQDYVWNIQRIFGHQKYGSAVIVAAATDESMTADSLVLLSNERHGQAENF